ncbi:hypothetical protein D920_01484 [Enterococcus faecalis 13-SD-W-01]|nr:hypothetical protein D920_01484 [Enterococcus faecalis 13-SD-W-01]
MCHVIIALSKRKLNSTKLHNQTGNDFWLIQFFLILSEKYFI